ncbi:MAG: hypothetical protein HY617_03925 [Candidatus Sungbacteria bacterium]|nr:hypothetical protein [Candidatus Sungbacteria bacterium]
MNTIQTPIRGEQDSTATKFNGQILQSVYRVWLFRKLLPVLIGEIIFLSLLLYGIGRLVFVERVIGNGFNVLFLNPTGIFLFGFDAFSHATGVTKLLAIAIVILAALVIRHITQGMLRLILVRQNYFGQIRK